MNDGERPNPEALLAAIQREAALQKRGRLKVFLGMCPGVGKTYAMLEAARRELAAKRDVVAGYVETHGRKETDALAADLPMVPRKTVEHRGITLTEMDLDAVLARRPRLALVDELAHTMGFILWWPSCSVNWLPESAPRSKPSGSVRNARLPFTN